MNYNIKGTEVSISPELRDYVEKRLAGHVDKFLSQDPSALADVELQYSPVRDGGRYRAEFTVSAAQALFRAEAWGTTLHEAIDLAIAELFREVRRAKRKRLHVFRHSAVKVKEFLRGWRSKL